MKTHICSPKSTQPSATFAGLLWNIFALLFVSGMHMLLWMTSDAVSFWDAMLYMIGGYVGCSISMIQLARKLSHQADEKGENLVN